MADFTVKLIESELQDLAKELKKVKYEGDFFTVSPVRKNEKMVKYLDFCRIVEKAFEFEGNGDNPRSWCPRNVPRRPWKKCLEKWTSEEEWRPSRRQHY